jgi:penicillin-binding protein 1A
MSASKRENKPVMPPQGLSQNQKSTGSRILKWLLKAVASVIGMGIASILAFLILLAIALTVAYPNLPEVTGLTDYRPKLPMRIYAADGVLLGEYGDERRSFMPIHQIPQVIKDAVLAIEDSRFYQHSGVDYKGVLRAGLAQFNEARSQGASTITMQVARNFYLSSEKTFTRKIYEILLAIKIEQQLNKDQILELYMNQIFLGQRAHGFAAASETYFGKSLKDISIAEAAMLAGLPKAPSAYNPITNPKRATIRQLYILERMHENGFITAEQRDIAKAEQLKYRAPSEVPVHAEYAAEAARQLVYNQYGEDTYTRGLSVYLTINTKEQATAYHALRRGILDFERRQAYRGPEAYIELPNNPQEVDARVAEALQEHPDNDELKSAVALQVSPKQVVAMMQSGEVATITGSGLRLVGSALSNKGNPKLQIRRGAVIRLIRSGNKKEWTLTHQPEVEGAFIALDPKTGVVRAMVGGFDYAKSKFNHVTQAWRQPGSSLKPFIYSAALEKGFTPSTLINDAPLFFDAGVTGSQPWEPKNYDGRFDGPMTFKNGLAKSKNMVSIRILQSIGAPYARNWLGRFGFDTDRHPPYLTMALGSGLATPLQVASAYSVFANGGYKVPPHLIAKVTDDKGRVIAEPKPVGLVDSMLTIEPRNAFVMTKLMQEVTKTGTAARAQTSLGRPDVYGKTGTTNDSMDAWFAGWQDSVVAVVWMGYDTPRKLGDHETGGGLALPIWIDYMSTALKGVEVAEPKPPEGVIGSGNDWYFEEFTRSSGVQGLGLEDRAPKPADDDERRSILDLFR